MGFSMNEGVERLIKQIDDMRITSQQAPGTTEATRQAQVMARAAQRALSSTRGPHQVRVTARESRVVVQMAGEGAQRLESGLARQRDQTIPMVQAAILSDLKAARR